MEYDISWHQNNVNNWSYSISKNIEDLKRLKLRIEDDQKQIDFYKLQIECAKKQNKDSFDRERFLIKRGTK